VAGPFPLANRPHPHHRRLGALLLASIATMALTTPLAAAGDDLKDKHRQVERRIDHAHDALEDSSSRAATASASLRRAEATLRSAKHRLHGTQVQLSAAERRDAAMQAALDRAVRNLGQARIALAEGRDHVADQKDAIAAYVTSVYEQGDPRLLGFAAVATAGDPGDMTRAIGFNESYTDREDAVLSSLETAERQLAEREDQVEERKEQVDDSRSAAAANLAAKEVLARKAGTEAAQVRALVQKRAARQHAAAVARAADRAVLARLQQKEHRISQMLARRAQRAVRNGAPGKSDGYLSYPVHGPITSYYGWRRHPIFGDMRLHNGVDFGAGCGQPLFAPADGVVVARGGGSWSPSGNYLFIDLGGVAGVGLSVSYSHATSYIVGVGQHVKRGQTVGYVGATGWATGCHLHFTVKENGVNVNPMKWF
jgi:murein DD-endopeptidase MepM/ murein hydrolase activator NlpD